MILLACAAPAPSDEPGLLALIPDDEVAVDPSTTEAQTHPTLARVGDGWLVAWDVGAGPRQRADLVALEGGPVTTLVEVDGAGFSTPDVVPGPEGDWHVAVRVGGDVRVSRAGAEPVTVGSGDLGFWTAPDLARAGDGLVVGWWDGPMDGPAAYVLARTDLDGDVVGTEVIATSPAGGSPLAIEAAADGFVLAWSEGDAIVVADEALATERVDDVALPYPPTRPALAVADDAVVVGWRAQDDDQRGAGVRLRWLGRDLAPLAPSFAVGLAPEETNRIELATDGQRVAAVWEEATAEGDVVVQLFDLATAAPLTGPVRVHDVLEGRQARPTVELRADELWVAFETGPEEASQVVVRRFGLAGG